MKECRGNDDKLFAEYQQDSESDQTGEFRQERKDCVAGSFWERLHAERGCRIMAR